MPDLDALRQRARTILAAVLVVVLFVLGYLTGRESAALPSSPAVSGASRAR